MFRGALKIVSKNCRWKPSMEPVDGTCRWNPWMHSIDGWQGLVSSPPRGSFAPADSLTISPGPGAVLPALPLASRGCQRRSDPSYPYSHSHSHSHTYPHSHSHSHSHPNVSRCPSLPVESWLSAGRRALPLRRLPWDRWSQPLGVSVRDVLEDQAVPLLRRGRPRHGDANPGVDGRCCAQALGGEGEVTRRDSPAAEPIHPLQDSHPSRSLHGLASLWRPIVL
jgi:hypothetical protein